MKEDIKKLPEEEILYIMRNESFQIKTENTIWKIIKEKLQQMKQENNNKKIERNFFNVH